MEDEIKVGDELNLALKDLLKPFIGHEIGIYIDGQVIKGRIVHINNIHTAKVKVLEV